MVEFPLKAFFSDKSTSFLFCFFEQAMHFFVYFILSDFFAYIWYIAFTYFCVSFSLALLSFSAKRQVYCALLRSLLMSTCIPSSDEASVPAPLTLLQFLFSPSFPVLFITFLLDH